jgi:hypothetical protein
MSESQDAYDMARKAHADKIQKLVTPNWERELVKLALYGHKHPWVTGHAVPDTTVSAGFIILTKQCRDCMIVVPMDAKVPDIPMPKGLREFDVFTELLTEAT